MNYRDPHLRRELAGQYVLGTLLGSARRQFERRLRSDGDLAAEVSDWERCLARLAMAVPPVAPPASVWSAIERRIGRARGSRRLNRWVAGWAVLATAASIVLAVLLSLRMSAPPAAPDLVAMLHVPDSSMHWTVNVNARQASLTMHAGGQPPAAAQGHDAELWWIGANGRPVALGVLPKHGQMQRALPAGMSMQGGGKLAVSLEPPGGSPTGQPTGPILLMMEVALPV